MKMLILLLLLTACGADDAVNVQCTEAGCVVPKVDTPAPTPAPVPTTPTADKPVAPVPTAEAKEYTVQFSFLVTTRDTRTGSQFCDTRYVAEMKEGGDPYAWTCDGEPAVFPDGLDGWDVNYGGFWTRNDTRMDSVDITKATYEDLKSNPGCKVSGAKLMKCGIQDNFVEIFTRSVMNRDELQPGGTFKGYMNINWKVYYWPDLSGY